MSQNKEKLMSEEERPVGNEANTVGNESFTHVSPETGKFTSWTIKVNCGTNGRNE